MPDLFGLGTWITSLALAGALGWTMGHRSGSLRGEPEQAGGIAATANRLADSSEAATLWSLTIRDFATCESTEAGDRSIVPAEMAQNRSALFADMPSLAELEASTEAIRLDTNVWEAPDVGERVADLLCELDARSRETLHQYDGSMRSLAHMRFTRERDLQCQPSPSSTRV